MLLNHERDGLDKRYMHTHSREQMHKALGEWGKKIISCINVFGGFISA